MEEILRHPKELYTRRLLEAAEKQKAQMPPLITMASVLFALHILLHEHIDRLIHACDGLLVILLHRFHDAVLHMLLQEELAGIIDLRTHCGELDQDIGAVPLVLEHFLDRLHMADGSGYPIHDRFDLLRVMRMAVIVMMSVMGVLDHMGVDMSIAMIVDKNLILCIFHKRF